jgi:hypothetical protein
VLWMAVQHAEKKALEIFAKEIASAGTGMAPGLTAVIGGRPKPTPLLRFFSYLSPKDELPIQIQTSDGHEETYHVPPDKENTSVKLLESERTLEESGDESSSTHNNLTKGNHSYTLSDLAWLRSGDKGDSCNIGVIARKPEYFPYIKSQLSAEKVRKYFEHKFSEQDGLSVCNR